MFCQIFEPTSTLDCNQQMLACYAWVDKSWTCCSDTLAYPSRAETACALHTPAICEETCRQEFLTLKRVAEHHRNACEEGTSWDAESFNDMI